MIGAAAVVAKRFGRVIAEKHRSGRFDLRQPSARFAQRKNQMFRRIAITDRKRLIQRLHLDQPRLRQRLARNVGTRQLRQLNFQLRSHRTDQRVAVGEQQHLRIGPVFGLRQ